jgi:hypothetical protein
MDVRFRETEARMDGRFDAMDRRLAEIIRSIGKLTEKLDQHVKKSDDYFEHCNTVLGEYQKRLRDLERPPSV